MKASIVRRFGKYEIDIKQQVKIEALRIYFQNLAATLDDCMPSGHEKSNALERLEEAMFWANAGITRKELTDDESARNGSSD